MVNYLSLVSILETKRPYGSQEEIMFSKGLFDFLRGVAVGYKGKGIEFVRDDEVYCYGIQIGQSETIFSCHTDTVHHDGGLQKVKVDGYLICLPKSSKSNCLGADDGAGIWLMANMITKGVPGMYLFHLGEECGGIGAGVMAEDYDKFLGKYKRAIAFDRRGTGSVVTHQGGVRCASDKFGRALSMAIGRNLLSSKEGLSLDKTGYYTDVADYKYIIPEVVNISIGYQNEHSIYETVDKCYLDDLLYACERVNWESMPTERTTDGDFGYYVM